jgi:hypothetical protein
MPIGTPPIGDVMLAQKWAGNMRRRSTGPGQKVHSKRFPFETNPTSRLTARTSRSLGRICSANSAVAVARFFTAVCFDFFGQQETRE